MNHKKCNIKDKSVKYEGSYMTNVQMDEIPILRMKRKKLLKIVMEYLHL